MPPAWRIFPLVSMAANIASSIWMEKGLGMVVAGFIPSPTESIPHYAPTLTELLISVGIYATGALILTALYKIVVSVRERAAAPEWAEEKPAEPAKETVAA